MFQSFFPRPKLFFWSALLWTAIVMALWYAGGAQLGSLLGLGDMPGTISATGISRFWSPSFLWFYLYFILAVGIFTGFWQIFAPHPWSSWSILGSALIVFVTYFQVQISVAINDWYGRYFNLIQEALAKTRPVTAWEFYEELMVVAALAFVAVGVGALTRFFISHYVFRWRTAMNAYYMSNWGRIRFIEGSSQRVQDDTMRFSSTMETLGGNFIEAVMTLMAFLPILYRLSAHITEVPIIGEIPHSLVIIAIVWSIFGTGFLALVGIKLPGLQFRNQRVEAAYRKELVYGEDDPNRAQPPTVNELFSHVRHNYFRLYFHYVYFNVARIFYLQADRLLPYLIIIPAVVSAKITFGVMQQIFNAFSQVRDSFQYLVNSWGTIIEVLSIYKRLRGLDAAIRGEPLPEIDQRYLEGQPAQS